MEVTVDVDVDEVLAAMSDDEIQAVAADRAEKRQGGSGPTAQNERALWQRVREAARVGDADRFVSLVEELAWTCHDTYLETSRLHLARAA